MDIVLRRRQQTYIQFICICSSTKIVFSENNIIFQSIHEINCSDEKQIKIYCNFPFIHFYGFKSRYVISFPNNFYVVSIAFDIISWKGCVH